MIVIDSSGWLEFFADGENSEIFAGPILTSEIVVPVIVIYEVFKKILRERDVESAFQAVASLHCYKIAAIDEFLALAAAEISVACNLPMADSLIYAVAKRHGAILWTQDGDFEGLPDVRFVPKVRRES